MAHLILESEIRKELGNKVRKLRRDGIIPAVVYGNGITPIHIQVKNPEFLRTYKEAGGTRVVDLKIDNGELLPCIIHDIDIHPVRDTVRHVDFLAVNLKEKVSVFVPIKLINESPAVREFGAVVVASMTELEVEALPDSIPEFIEVDLSVLKTMDDVIHAEDIKSTDSYTILEDPESTIVTLSVESPEEVEETATVVETTEPAAV